MTDSPNPKLIGLTGYAQHGKNTAAEILREREGFELVAFADALRELALAADPWVEPDIRYSEALEQLGYEKAKNTLPEFRRFLQDLGTGVRNILGADIWVEVVKRRIADIPGPVVLTDVRFPNEAKMVRDLGGELWGVLRLEATDDDDVEVFDNGLGQDHPSEAWVKDLIGEADFVLAAKSVDDLERLVAAVPTIRALRDRADDDLTD